jgi:HEAT repeat protein
VSTFRESLRAARRVKDPFLRAERVRVLGEFDAPGVVDALIAFLDPSETSMVRTAAAAALNCVGDACAVEVLIRCLADPWYDVRCQAAAALARIGDRRATAPLNCALPHEQDGYAIAAFLEALGPLGNASSVEPLLAHASRYPKRVEAALVQIGQPAVEPLTRALDGRDAAARQVAAAALGQIGDERAIEPLRKLLARSRDVTLLTAVAQALHRLGWSGTGPRFRQLALIAQGEWDALAHTGRPALRWLIHALRHRESLVRCGAASTLAEIGDPDAVPALVRCFQAWQEKDGRTRQAAARALGQLGDPRAVEPLLARVTHQETGSCDRSRQVEIEALAQIGDPRAIAPLIEIALSDRAAEQRREALHGLGAWRDPRIVEALRHLLADGNLDVRRSAAEKLGRQGWEPGGPDEGAALLIAAQHWEALAAQGKARVPVLVRMLGGEISRVQPEIARALGRIGDLAAARVVIAWLFAHPVQILDEATCQDWIDAMRPLLGGYAAPVVRAACYARIETHVLRKDPSVTEHAYTYDLGAGDSAIRWLSELNTAISTCILLRVAEKVDAIVDVSFFENEWTSGTSQGTLSFSGQRELARRALQRRPDARCDPSTYEIPANWALRSDTR